MERARITVCCDLDLEKATNRAEQIAAYQGSVPRVTTDYQDVLADPDVDAIDLCTPPQFHMDEVVAAAQAGKHLACQKPLARTLPECDAMIAAFEEAGKVLFYSEFFRTMTTAVAAKRVVDEGRIGEIVGIQATYAHWQGGVYLTTPWRYNPAVAGGGQLLDGGIHTLDIMHQVGGPVESVTCFTRRVRAELGGEDTAVVNMRYAGGHLGTFMSTHAAGIYFPGPIVSVFGTKAILTIGGPFGGLTLHAPDLPDRREVLIAERTDTFVSMIGHFLDVLEGVPSIATAQVGRDDLQLVLAAYRSAELGREVRLDEIL